MGYEESLVLAVHEKYPDRIIPFLTTVRWGWHFRGATYLAYVERQLQTGKFKGMGEFMVKHYSIPPIPDEVATPEFTVPADSPWMQDIMRLGAKYNVPLLIHMETEPDTVAALDRALLANPNTKVIWAHQNPLKMGGGPEEQYARQADPSQLAALLDKHPNLFCDISVGREGMFLDLGRDRQLPESWKNLYEKYNDRFVVGIDRAYKTVFEKYYVPRSKLFRGWLSQLSSATAKKLAYENIERILSQASNQK
jgi:predicted TIM-barrel fold metal-dependent hydrolase